MPPHNRASNSTSRDTLAEGAEALPKQTTYADLGIPALKAALALRNRIRRQDKLASSIYRARMWGMAGVDFKALPFADLLCSNFVLAFARQVRFWRHAYNVKHEVQWIPRFCGVSRPVELRSSDVNPHLNRLNIPF